MPPLAAKTIQPPCGRGNASPLWWLAPPPCPVGSMSLDSRVAGLPYESSSFATSRGNEKIGGTGYCVTYDTDSQSRNVLASPLGEEGHEVAKGCTRVRMIMILDVDVTAERRHYNTHRPLKGKRLTTFCASLRSGGCRLAVRTAMEHPIGALPRTPFCLFEAFPLKGKRENRWHWILCHI